MKSNGYIGWECLLTSYHGSIILLLVWFVRLFQADMNVTKRNTNELDTTYHAF